MSRKSNNQGRAYEYICLTLLFEEINKVRPATIEFNDSFYTAQRAWHSIGATLKDLLKKSALSIIETLFDLEPLILEKDTESLILKIQSDKKGESGDVRDILIIRCQKQWEIGLSIKHNHFAVKHSRLSKTLDFCDKWLGIPCSKEYWNEVKPIFDTLEKLRGTKWRDLISKEQDVYKPLLIAFINEIKRKNDIYSDIPKKLTEYLLGYFDFYKIISIDNRQLTQIQSYNLRGTLNKSSSVTRPKIHIPLVALPTRIVLLDFKFNSTNTIELYMNNGWQFSFRIHNASSNIEPSLKFDIQIIGMPTSIISINCKWY